MFQTKLKKQGFSLVEIILAVALFGLFATALIGLLMNSYGSNFQAEEKDVATLYAQEGLDAVWSIRRQAWNLLTNGDYGLDNSSGYWQFSGTSELLENKYTRVITIEDACRDISGDIVDCPGNGVDLHTKKATATVTYTAITFVANTVELVSYLSTWQSRDWIQTDWVGGAGQTIWSDATRYSSDDGNINATVSGQVTLATVGGVGSCGIKSWPFDNAGLYTLPNPAEIEVSGGLAQLIDQAGGGGSGGTINPDFDIDATGWTYSDWNQGGGEVNVTGSHNTTGGNPSGYVDVNIPSGKQDEVGGYWEQAFTTIDNSPTVTVDFDYIVSQFDPTPNTFQLYVFVDSASGQPTIGQEVWSSGEITGTTSWTPITSVNASSQVTTAGTYYLKIAVWVETSKQNKGPFTIGYDNVQLSWSGGVGIPSYPTNGPRVEPNNFYTTPDVEEWSLFAEVASKDGGEIYYQLSEDEGNTWLYFNNPNWISTGLCSAPWSNCSTATEVNSNIDIFPTSSDKILFRAYLVSNGSQFVQLDNVKIGWGDTSGGAGFTTFGSFTSSAFDSGSSSSFNIISWSESLPACSPACDIQAQIRTAPDAGGSPGAWSAWYGAAGAGTFFTDPIETLLAQTLNFNQWMQYRIELIGDGLDTPIFNEININYTP